MVLFNFYSNFILVTHDYSCSVVIIACHYFYFKQNNGDLQQKTIKTTVIQCISGRGALFSVIMLTKSNLSGYIPSALQPKLHFGHLVGRAPVNRNDIDWDPGGPVEYFDFLG